MFITGDTMLNKDDLIIKVGRYQMVLNPNFLTNNNAENNLDKIKELFVIKFNYFLEMDKTEDSKELKKLEKKVWANEKLIMTNFNFKVDKNYFRFWEMPKCTCPKLDNIDYWGTGNQIYSLTCPVHGTK